MQIPILSGTLTDSAGDFLTVNAASRLLVVAACAALSACAAPPDAPLTNAVAGQSADVVITGLGLELVDPKL